MAWLMTIFTGGVLLLLHKKWKKWKKWWVVLVVCTLFACSLAATSLGGWLAGLLASLLGLIGGWISTPGALLGTVLMILGSAAVIYGFVHDRKADKWEQGLLIVLPLLFIISAGPVAAGGGTLTDAVSGFGSQGLAYLVGG